MLGTVASLPILSHFHMLYLFCQLYFEGFSIADLIRQGQPYCDVTGKVAPRVLLIFAAVANCSCCLAVLGPSAAYQTLSTIATIEPFYSESGGANVHQI